MIAFSLSGHVKLRREMLQQHTWSMPTYWQGHNIIHFASAKKHIGLYPGPAAVEQFAERLEEAGCKYNKGSIQILYSDELPLNLISEIAAWHSSGLLFSYT